MSKVIQLAELGMDSCSYSPYWSLAPELLKLCLGVKPPRAGKDIPVWVGGTGQSLSSLACSSSERVTAEMPATASGKHESVLAREGRTGARNGKRFRAFHLYVPFWGGVCVCVC